MMTGAEGDSYAAGNEAPDDVPFSFIHPSWQHGGERWYPGARFGHVAGSGECSREINHRSARALRHAPILLGVADCAREEQQC